jgi:hypothetical protein
LESRENGDYEYTPAILVIVSITFTLLWVQGMHRAFHTNPPPSFGDAKINEANSIFWNVDFLILE